MNMFITFQVTRVGENGEGPRECVAQLNQDIWFRGKVVLQNLEFVVEQFDDCPFIGVTAAVVRGREKGDHLRKVTALPQVSLEPLKLRLMGSDDGHQTIVLQESADCSVPDD